MILDIRLKISIHKVVIPTKEESHYIYQMHKIHQNILVIIVSLFVIPLTFYIFGLIFNYFNLERFTSENIFIERSSCDPSEAEPTIFGSIIVLLTGLFISITISYSTVKTLIRYRIIR